MKKYLFSILFCLVSLSLFAQRSPVVYGPHLPPVAIGTYVAALNTAAGGDISYVELIAMQKLKNRLDSANLTSSIYYLNLCINHATACKYNFIDYTKNVGSFVGTSAFGGGRINSTATGNWFKTNFKAGVDAAGQDADFGYNIFLDADWWTPASQLRFALGVSASSGNNNTDLRLYPDAQAQGYSYKAIPQALINQGTSDAVGGSTGSFQSTPAKVNMKGDVSVQRTNSTTLEMYMDGGLVATKTTTTFGSNANNGSGTYYDFLVLCKQAGGTAYTSNTTLGGFKYMCFRKSMSKANIELLTQILHQYLIDAGKEKRMSVFFGDSIVDGRYDLTGGWARNYGLLANRHIRNWGLSGDQISAWYGDGTNAYRAYNSVPTYNSAVHKDIFLADGTNELLTNVTAATFKTNLIAAIQLFKARGWPASRIYVVGMYYKLNDNNASGGADYYTNAYTPACSQEGVTLIDAYTWEKNSATDTAFNARWGFTVTSPNDLYSPDDINGSGASAVHHNSLGARWFGAKVFELIGN